MENIRFGLAIVIAKLSIIVLRLFRSGGTSLPGKIALRICPAILDRLSVKFKVIMITGTNGKTTTSRMVASLLKENKIGFITNKSGANLSSGITTTLIDALELNGKPKLTTALLETDEAAFKSLAPKLKPEMVIATNFFRDQLDRYGELYTTLNHVRQGISGTPSSTLILNADDSLCASLGQHVKNPVVYFGMSDGVYPQQEAVLSSDAAFCLQCQSKYEYSSISFGHLGHFNCPSCGYQRPAAQVECIEIASYDSLGSNITIESPDCTFSVKLAIPGLYNIYNALASASLGWAMGFKQATIQHALESFELGFGRMESIEVENRSLKVILVKNPTGFNQVLSYLQSQKERCVMAFVINDKLADGTDISWLWDVDFEKLPLTQDKVKTFFVSGLRAEDMAVRLKYAGIYANKIEMEKNYSKLIQAMLDQTGEKETCYILPTYTAMLDLRQTLKNRFGLKEFWE